MDYRQPEVTQVSEADFFTFQWEHHIWSTFKKSYITPPACAAFAVEQTNELLLHFTFAVRTDSLAGSHKSLLELGNNFIGGHTAGKQLFQYGFCFSLFGFFCGLFFGSNLFCLCFRKFLCCNLQSRFFTFQLFLQCNISIFFLSRNGNAFLDNKSGAFCKAPLLFIEKTTSYACGRKEP